MGFLASLFSFRLSNFAAVSRPGYEESVYESPARLDASTARGSAKKLTALFLHWIPNSE